MFLLSHREFLLGRGFWWRANCSPNFPSWAVDIQVEVSISIIFDISFVCTGTPHAFMVTLLQISHTETVCTINVYVWLGQELETGKCLVAIS